MRQVIILKLSLLCTASALYHPATRKAGIDPDRCTAIAAAPGATVDGSTFNTHNSDCAECDWRVNKVPARDWPKGHKRPIYLLSGTYPRQVRKDRGYTWSPENLEHLPQRKEWENMLGKTIIGYIPQVAHTYGLIEGYDASALFCMMLTLFPNSLFVCSGYGMMNEHQVSIGESTCATRLWAAPVGFGGKALLEASELSQIALERGPTALCAVQLMGQLAEQYGFYSAEWDPNDLSNTLSEGGEALTVADPNEVYMFHILPDDTGTSAVWVARRVPDNHITAVANQFVIREVDPADPSFLYSSNLWEVAQRAGLWSNATGGLLDFLTTYGVQRLHPAYATRRVWRVLSLAAPSLNLPSSTDPWGSDYPFSVAVDSPLAVTDIMSMMRDHYEGTPFSTTEGIAGGPYGDPNRWDLGAVGNLTYDQEAQGEWPRTISLFR